jgi:superfamily II DNA or RNA helicase
MRMKAMMGYKSKEEKVLELLARRKTKTILFANTQEQADRLAPHSYHSSNPKSAENLELFKNNEIELLSAVEQLSEGVNIPNLRSGIIMHAYSNNRKTSQKLGRMLRLNPDDTAGIHILCYRDTVDEQWVRSAIESFDKDKIVWLN